MSEVERAIPKVVLSFLVGALITAMVIGQMGLVPVKGKERLQAEANAVMCKHYLTDHAVTELDSLRIITTMPDCEGADDE